MTTGKATVWLLTWNFGNEMREFLLWANGVWWAEPW